MSLMDFIKKQFVDVIEWTEEEDGVLAWRYPFEDREIQSGATLVVRESQLALFVNEGQVGDLFGPGTHTLNTRTLPVLTNLRHWDKLFASPFKCDVYFFSTRQQLDLRWGTAQPITLRDKDFGAVRLRAFGNCAVRLRDARHFHVNVSGTRERYTVHDLDGQLRGVLLQHLSDAVAQSGVPFLDLAANQVAFAQALQSAVAPTLEAMGLQLDGLTVQNISLPEELQKVLDQRIGMGMVGQANMGQFVQYQAAQALPQVAASGGQGGSVAGDAASLGAGLALGQVMAQSLQQGLQGHPGGPGVAAPSAAPMSADEVLATLEKLGDLHVRGILTPEEFSAKKAELLKKLG